MILEGCEYVKTCSPTENFESLSQKLATYISTYPTVSLHPMLIQTEQILTSHLHPLHTHHRARSTNRSYRAFLLYNLPYYYTTSSMLFVLIQTRNQRSSRGGMSPPSNSSSLAEVRGKGKSASFFSQPSTKQSACE